MGNLVNRLLGVLLVAPFLYPIADAFRALQPDMAKMTAELARALISVQADEETQTRYDELAEKHNEGELNAEQRAELESIVRFQYEMIV